MKRIECLMIFLLSLFCLPVSIFATSLPDLNKTGSITVAVTDYETGENIEGGELEIYRLASVSECLDKFEPTEDFSECKADFNNSGASEMVDTCYEWITENNIKKYASASVSSTDTVFEGLPLGLYLVNQSKNAEDYGSISPFIISVPMYQNGEYVYEVNAEPKGVFAVKEDTGTDKEEETEEDKDKEETDKEEDKEETDKEKEEKNEKDEEDDDKRHDDDEYSEDHDDGTEGKVQTGDRADLALIVSFVCALSAIAFARKRKEGVGE